MKEIEGLKYKMAEEVILEYTQFLGKLCSDEREVLMDLLDWLSQQEEE